MDNKTNIFFEKIFQYFILIILISEFLTKSLIQYNFEYFQISTLSKVFLEVVLLLYFTVNKMWSNKNYYLILILLFFFIIGQLFTVINTGFNFPDILNNIFTLNTYLYFILFAICVSNQPSNQIIGNSIKIIKQAALINSFAILLGLMFSIELFKSYPNTARFGYNGLLGFSSSASFFYIAVILILYIDSIKSKNFRNKLILISQIIISILVGTKTIWFFLILLGLIHFCIIIKKPLRLLFQSLTVLGITLFVVFKDKIELFIVSLFNFGQYYYEKHGFITVITSTRDLYLKKVFDYYLENGTFANVLFGGMNVFKIRVEFEFINMFIFFGIAGMITYLLLLKKIFVLPKQKIIKTLLFIIVILTCAMSGGLFYSVFSSILIYIAFKYMDILTHENEI